MERLKDKADALAPQAGALAIGQLGGIDAVEQVRAAGWMIQAADDVEQRRFSGTGWAGDRKPFAALEREINVDECMDGRFASICFADLVQLEYAELLRKARAESSWLCFLAVGALTTSVPTTTS